MSPRKPQTVKKKKKKTEDEADSEATQKFIQVEIILTMSLSVVL